ncbi:hypothetical protein BH10ACI2_BH10ACI2_09470 [soil metagenome]
MDDLDLVFVANLCLRPVDAANDRIVKLDRDTLFWKRKKLQQTIEVNL